MTKTSRKNYNKKFKSGHKKKIHTCQAEGCDIPIGQFREYCVDHENMDEMQGVDLNEKEKI